MNKKTFYLLLFVFALTFIVFNLLLKFQPGFIPQSPLAPKNFLSSGSGR
jgi:hypothetical protein